MCIYNVHIFRVHSADTLSTTSIFIHDIETLTET